MKEETFGPVIPVMGFDSIEDALHLMNDTKYGLSGSVFGSVDIAENVAKQMQAGAISINDAGLTAMLRDGEKQSFKKSGIGETRMGRSSMLRFLRKKALYFNHNEDSDPWWFN
jgi:acyl-CoA reductase-like NAD-dependent aldehyde dehydrogenase